MSKVKVTITDKNGEILAQKEFETEMASVRKALSEIEQRQQQSAAPRPHAYSELFSG